MSDSSLSMLSSLTAVAVGGALGALARFGTGRLVHLFVAPSFPWATWTVNLAGCLLIGLSVPLLGQLIDTKEVHLLLVTGFLGSFTTFSTFSLDTMALWTDGYGLRALANAAGSVGLGLLFVGLGLWLGNVLT